MDWVRLTYDAYRKKKTSDGRWQIAWINEFCQIEMNMKPLEKKKARARFETTKLDAAQKNIHIYIGIASVCNFLFLICDLAFIHGQTERLICGILRYCFSVLLILLVKKLQRIGLFSAFSGVVTTLEAVGFVLFFSIMLLYETPNFMIQAMGILLTILVVFLVPNRSENMFFVSVVASSVFFAYYGWNMQNIEAREYIAAVIFSTLTILICTVKAICADRYAQADFLARSRLELTSTRDFLTNAATRERLEEEAKRWMNFCRRQSLPLCLVFVDVDDLKRINDQYGHTIGDIALKEVAKLLQNQLRNSDTIARWGGDEFVLLLPNVSLQNAVLLLDRVKSAVSFLKIEGGIPVSCSFGVVQMGAESTYSQLLAEADAMMYRAKQNGKGRISFPNKITEENLQRLDHVAEL